MIMTAEKGMSELNNVPDQDYAHLLAAVKERVRSAQYAALKAVNTELVGLYWDIGRMIAERQAKAGWGRAVVENLSADLRREFPGVAGFSVQNLWYMRQFYLEYHGYEKLQPLVGEIAWAHNLVIMSRCKDPLEREFYIRMTRKFGWSKNVLIHQIDNQSYEDTSRGCSTASISSRSC
jgi:predicted nuclease of restriction endonuclease-like (RecB) superfamily